MCAELVQVATEQVVQSLPVALRALFVVGLSSREGKTVVRSRVPLDTSIGSKIVQVNLQGIDHLFWRVLIEFCTREVQLGLHCRREVLW